MTIHPKKSTKWIISVSAFVLLMLFSQEAFLKDNNEPIKCPSGTKLIQTKKETYCEGQKTINGKQVPVRNGPFHFWYDANGKRYTVRAKFKDGKIHGVYKMYAPEGYKYIELNYRQGILTGPYTAWYNDGKISIKLSFKNGLTHGRYKVWNRDGRLTLTGRFKNGKQHGRFKTYHLGKVNSCTLYKNGVFKKSCYK